MNVECAQLPIPQGKKGKSERSEEENRRNRQEKEKADWRGRGERKNKGEMQVRLGEELEKESWQPAQKDRRWDDGLFSSSVRQIPVFFLGCLVSWLKISELNGALGTERGRGM